MVISGRASVRPWVQTQEPPKKKKKKSRKEKKKIRASYCWNHLKIIDLDIATWLFYKHMTLPEMLWLDICLFKRVVCTWKTQSWGCISCICFPVTWNPQGWFVGSVSRSQPSVRIHISAPHPAKRGHWDDRPSGPLEFLSTLTLQTSGSSFMCLLSRFCGCEESKNTGQMGVCRCACAHGCLPVS
jgi:hypothetical protein